MYISIFVTFKVTHLPMKTVLKSNLAVAIVLSSFFEGVSEFLTILIVLGDLE